MSNFRDEFIKGILETLKIPATAFNIALVSDEIEHIENTDLRAFYKAVVSIDTYGNGMRAIIDTAKEFKQKTMLEMKIDASEEQAKAMYEKFYDLQAQITTYTQANREQVSNDREFFRNISYDKLENQDGSKTLTKSELFVLTELGGGDFLIDITYQDSSKSVTDKIKIIIAKAVKEKYADTDKLMDKRVSTMLGTVQ